MRIIYYRALNDLRALIRPTGSLFARLKIVFYLVSVAALLFLALDFFSRMFAHFKLQITGESSRLFEAFNLGMLATGILIFSVFFMELFREIGFPKDDLLLAPSPISLNRLIGYRAFFASCRSLPWCAAWILFPLSFAASFLDHWCLVAVALNLFFVVWLMLIALMIVSAVLYSAARGQISRSVLFAAAYAATMGILGIIVYYLVSPDVWINYVDQHHHQGLLPLVLPYVQIGYVLRSHHHQDFLHTVAYGALFYLTIFVTGASSYLAALNLLPQALAPAARTRAKDRPRALLSPILTLRSPVLRRRHWAIFQKDLKDLLRNPIYRNSLLAFVALLGIGLWAQFRTVSRDRFIGLINLTLSLIQLIPLLFSARTIALEHRMLDFYRLLLPDLGQLLDVKWKAQAIVNCLVVMTAAVPFFVLLRPGFRVLEVSLFLTALLCLVPIFTMLAIALGTYFPHFSDVLSVMGIRVKGIVFYSLITLPIYSIVRELYIKILRNSVDLAFMGIVAAMVISVSALSWALFLRARRKLSTNRHSWQV